jgi:hypothetical protein
LLHLDSLEAVGFPDLLRLLKQPSFTLRADEAESDLAYSMHRDLPDH